jgi:hypothetical protein
MKHLFTNVIDLTMTIVGAFITGALLGFVIALVLHAT